MNSWLYILALTILGMALGLATQRVWRHYKPSKPKPPGSAQPVTGYTKH